jgi:cell division protein FtsN
LAQDDYYYEIQLSNKQLVFYFMAGATGLILSFLAGVMVGRGVDATTGEVQAARAVPVQEEKVVAEEAPARPAPPPAAEDLTYAQRLEGDKQDDALEKSKPASSGKTVAAAKPAGAAKPAVVVPAPKTDSVKPAAAAPAGTSSTPAANPKPTSAAPARPAGTPPAPAAKVGAAPKTPAGGAGAFTIQVGAFKDRASADSVVSRLKGKGFAAYVINPAAAEGLFNVRVGSYNNRTDAEHVQVRLRDEEKFKPFIVKN